jgi:HEAT repeat protein
VEKIPVKPLLTALHDQHKEVKAAAIESLGNLREDAPYEPLLAALNDPSWNVRRAAVEALEKRGVLVSLEQFIILMQDEDPEVRAVAARALRNFGEQMPIPPLLEALGDSEAKVCYSAAQSLIKQIQRVPIEPVLAIIDKKSKDRYGRDKYESRRLAAFDVLGNMGERAPVDTLFAALHDESERVRKEGIRALGKLKTITAGDAILAMLNDVHELPSTRAVALEVLVELEENNGIAALLAALNDPAEEVRKAAAKSLGKIKAHSSVEHLLTAASEHIEWIRLAAVSILGKLEEKSPIELLLVLLNDKDEACAVRAAAGQAIVKLGEYVSIKTIQAVFQHEDVQVRQTIAQLFPDPRILYSKKIPIVSLLVALKHENYEVRRTAACGLAGEKLPNSEVRLSLMDRGLPRVAAWLRRREASSIAIPEGLIVMLIELLNNDDENTYMIAARALGELGAYIPVELLRKLLKTLDDEKTQMRVGATRALIELEKYIPGSWLIEALDHEHWQVREAVIMVMGEIKGSTFVRPLLAALQDQQSEVRQAAAQALIKMKEPFSPEPLLDVLYDQDISVRLAMTSVLGPLAIPFSAKLAEEALHHPDIAIRLQAVPILAALGKPVPTEPLIAALSSTNLEVRRQGILTLLRVGKHSPIELWILALSNGGVSVKESLAGLEKDIPEKVLEDALNTGTTEVRRDIAYILGRRWKKASVELLLRVMDDPDMNVCFSVARGLGEAGIDMPIELLAEALQSDSPRIRQTAAQTLAWIKEAVPLNLLLTAFQDEDHNMHQMAARAISEHAEQVPLEFLLACLHTQTDADVLRGIVNALGNRNLGEQVPLEPMLNLFDREPERLRMSVMKALGQFGTRAPAELLTAALGDGDQDVREAAAEALKKTHPETLLATASEAIAVLQGQKPGTTFGSLAEWFFADVVTNMEHASPGIFEKLTQLLDWPYWQVRVKAINAFGKLRRNIPNTAIRRLQQLRYDPQSSAVRKAADEVLAEILSLETGIEDD